MRSVRVMRTGVLNLRVRFHGLCSVKGSDRILSIDEFTDRLARIRERFATALPGKIDDSFASVPKMSTADAEAIETIVVSHRRLHEMCGVAPSIGFPDTGKAAREAESVLREPAKSRRPLTADEIEAFMTKIESLRSAAKAELRSNIA
jgi:hypothetical protein